MDEIEQLVVETYKHFQSHSGMASEESKEMFYLQHDVSELPADPGILYHIQKSASLFVIRSFVSKCIREDYQRIMESPENYPSLRLLEGGDDELEKKLRFFILENHHQAEVIHDQVANRRFPMNEEIMCNLSDPGFSWWLTKKNDGFQLAFTLSVSSEQTLKLGPIGDQQLALKNFQQMESLLQEAGLTLNIQNEMNRVQFNEGEELLLEELKDIFEFGVMGEGMTKLFMMLSRRIGDHAQLESLWLYLNELAAMRRFWIQVQYDLSA